MIAIGLVFLALAVSASALAQTSADTAGKKAPALDVGIAGRYDAGLGLGKAEEG